MLLVVCCKAFVASDRIIGISIKVRLLSHRQTALLSRVKETINGHPNASKGFNYLFGNKNVVYWDLLNVSNYPPRPESAGSTNMLHCEYRVCKNKLNRVADIAVRREPLGTQGKPTKIRPWCFLCCLLKRSRMISSKPHLSTHVWHKQHIYYASCIDGKEK